MPDKTRPASKRGEMLVAFVLLCLLTTSAALARPALLSKQGEEGPAVTDQGADASEPAQQASDEELAQLARDNNSFAFNLYQVLRRERPEQNIFCSPYSISQALAMTYAGARESTEEQMMQALQFSLGQERLHPAFNRFDRLLIQSQQATDAPAHHSGTQFQLNVANAIWPHADFALLTSFTELLNRHYGIETHPQDYTQAEQARQNINAWVAERTEQRILDLIPAGVLSRDTRLVLTNAIYFIASWQQRFNPNYTQADVFTPLDGSEARVPFMSQTFRYRHLVRDDVQVVSLPYFGSTLSMLVVMPSADNFEEFDGVFGLEQLEELRANLVTGLVHLSLPKFRVESSLGLNDALAALGMPLAFDGEQANFSGMAEIVYPEDNLYISAVIHKAFLEVNEEGTEAAAATAVVMARVGSAAPPEEPLEISINQPFMVFIQDDQSGAILFMGRVLDPR